MARTSALSFQIQNNKTLLKALILCCLDAVIKTVRFDKSRFTEAVHSQVMATLVPEGSVANWHATCRPCCVSYNQHLWPLICSTCYLSPTGCSSYPVSLNLGAWPCIKRGLLLSSQQYGELGVVGYRWCNYISTWREALSTPGRQKPHQQI